MIAAACYALSDCAPILRDPELPVLPDFDCVHEVSKSIALAVAQAAFDAGVDDLGDRKSDIQAIIDGLFWQPEYVDYVKVSS